MDKAARPPIMRGMKHLLTALLLAFASILSSRAEETPIRLLLTTGGHGFQEKEFFAMFDALPGVTYTKATMPAGADLLRPGLETTCDVLVMYDMVTDITPAQRAAFTNLLQSGIGVVSLHHNLGAHRTWPEYRRIIGGAYLFKPESIDGQAFPPSTYSHGEDIPVTVADREHPITRGLSDFVLRDETYGGFYVSPAVHVLLTTDHPKSGRALMWTTRYGNSRVVAWQGGHDSAAWRHPNFPLLLGRAIRWAAGRPPL